MIMGWIKLMTNGGECFSLLNLLGYLYKEQGLMKSLYRLPYIRHGILLNLFEWFAKNVQLCQTEVLSASSQELKAITRPKGYMIERG